MRMVLVFGFNITFETRFVVLHSFTFLNFNSIAFWILLSEFIISFFVAGSDFILVNINPQDIANFFWKSDL